MRSLEYRPLPSGRSRHGRGLQLIGESDLCPFSLQSDRLHMVGIRIQIETMLFADFLDEEIGDPAIEVIASEMCVAIGR